MGCGALDFRQQAQQMELKTGGMSVSTEVIPDSTHMDVYEQVSTALQRSLSAVVYLESNALFHYDATVLNNVA